MLGSQKSSGVIGAYSVSAGPKRRQTNGFSNGSDVAVRSACLTQSSKATNIHPTPSQTRRVGENLSSFMVVGKRSRGRPKMRLGDHWKDVCGKTSVELCRMAQDRERWRRYVGATAAQIRVSR